MSMLEQAARKALEALERADKRSGYQNNKKTIAALREALEDQPAPEKEQSQDSEDAARWRMAVLVSKEMMTHPDKRTSAAVVSAYVTATGNGLDFTGAIDAARTAGEKL